MWQAFALLDLASYAYGLLVDSGTPYDAWRVSGLVFDGAGVIGLLIYAFTGRALIPGFWKAYTYVYAAWVAVSMSKGVADVTNGQISTSYVVLGIMIAALWQIAALTAIYRLGRRTKD